MTRSFTQWPANNPLGALISVSKKSGMSRDVTGLFSSCNIAMMLAKADRLEALSRQAAYCAHTGSMPFADLALSASCEVRNDSSACAASCWFVAVQIEAAKIVVT